MLAGVSPDYYSRIEQGRQKTVSIDVLDALARALRLTDIESTHLRQLANPKGNRRRATDDVEQLADAGMLRLMVALDHLPVLLLGQRGEIFGSQ